MKDKGFGMSKKLMSTLFSHEHVVRRNGQNLESVSNGMGLLICKSICEQLEGSIEVDSILGKGSIFTFKVRAKPQIETLSVINEESSSVSDCCEEGKRSINPSEQRQLKQASERVGPLKRVRASQLQNMNEAIQL